MKARSNSKRMKWRQERLWEQRRLLSTQQRRHDLRREQDEQWRVLTEASNQARTWGRYDAGDGGMQLANTSSNSWYNHRDLAVDEEPNEQQRVKADSARQVMLRVRSDDGSPFGSMIGSGTTAESWKTLKVEKSCNSGRSGKDPLTADGGSGRRGGAAGEEG
ncbi:hypothetical protein PF005_g13721 [Phytophthora fragariae]|uniref:Uncharacterized protein n=1 Tax=Phytophthora fragariae TaxID=53985 RepID=A0A6A3XSE7_9STRA|nr:hypothetical protein PF005_g13721 [Phytophthora fragariae]